MLHSIIRLSLVHIFGYRFRWLGGMLIYSLIFRKCQVLFRRIESPSEVLQPGELTGREYTLWGIKWGALFESIVGIGQFGVELESDLLRQPKLPDHPQTRPPLIVIQIDRSILPEGDAFIFQQSPLQFPAADLVG